MVNININNKKELKEFIIYRLTKVNKINKGNKVFKVLIKMYSKYPNTAKNIIAELYRFTYYKDYFRILCLSKNEEINNYIYEILGEQLNKDIIGFNAGEKISMLAKWMPRKGKFYDKKLNFVNLFGKRIIYGGDEYKGRVNRTKMYGKYRKIITTLTRYINPIELSLCEKNYEEMKKIKPTKKNLEMYNKFIKKTDFMVKYLENSINNATYDVYISKIMNMAKKSDYKKGIQFKEEIEMLDNVWSNKNSYSFDKYSIMEKSELMERDILVIDYNSNMLSNLKKNLYRIIFMMLYRGKMVLVNTNYGMVEIKYNESVFKVVEQIEETMVMSSKMHKGIENYKDKSIVLITCKDVEQYIDLPLKVSILSLSNKMCIKIKNSKLYEGDPMYKSKDDSKMRLLNEIFDKNRDEMEEKKDNIICVSKYDYLLMVLLGILLIILRYIYICL